MRRKKAINVARKIKKISILVFLCISFLFLQGLLNYLRAEEESITEVSVSVEQNPVNRLAKKIDELKGLIGQKREEFKEKKESDINIFLNLSGIIILVGIGIFLFNSYSRYLKREVRKEKKRLKRKLARRRNAKKRKQKRKKR